MDNPARRRTGCALASGRSLSRVRGPPLQATVERLAFGCMVIDWDENVCGLKMLQVRDLLRVISDGYALVEIRKGVPAAVDFSTLIKVFEEREWIEHCSGGYIRTTIGGQAVAMAKKLARFSRAKGEALLGEVIERAKEVNANPHYAYDVEELAVIGSYLNGHGDLGDLDVVYRLVGRWDLSNERSCHEAFERSHAVFPPPQRYGFIDRLGWPSAVIRRRLKVSNRVSMHDFDELARLGWLHRTVYKFNVE